MRQPSTYDKIALHRRLLPPIAVSRLRQLCYPLLMLLPKAKVKYRVEILNHWDAEPNKPIIFAANHSAFPDIPIALKAIGRHSYVLLGKQNLAILDEFFFWLNGVIWVDRKNREDTAAAKLGIQAYLAQGHTILWFPEATWNLTDNLLMLPMRWGIIDVARQADAQIIPMALDYDREKMVCRVQFGKPLTDDALLDKPSAIRDLRDALATMRWDFWERNSTFHRKDLDMDVERKKLFYSVEEYPPIDWDYESSCIYHPYTEQKNVFAHLDKLIPCKENAFLFRKK